MELFGIVGDLVLHRQLKFEKGKIVLFNMYGAMLPISSYVNIQKELEKKGMENMLYQSAKETGRIWNSNMKESYKAKTAREIFEWGNKVMNISGWGEFRVHEDDYENSHLVYRLYDSQMAKEYGKSKHTVCQIPRGLFAGSACFVMKKDVDAVETKCLSKGDPFCEFEIKPKREFDSKKDEAKRQLKSI